ncbi:MAG: ImmA/IrrE family metallo-endopeptidase [Thermodesulfobacteriota bacterium]
MEKNNRFTSPEQLLNELGITRPDEIDIEAIAFHCGATIRYRPLTGCAARIVGYRSNAIITVDSGSPRARQRFSAAHELGHWTYDRGKASFSCQETQFVREWSRHNSESRANIYASDLLLPASLFTPMASTFKTMDFDVVKSLAETFTTSLTATAIRLVEYGPLPIMLVCYNDAGREWFVRGSCVSEQLWPSKMPESGTYAFDLLKSGMECEIRGEVPAEAWFEHRCAERYYIQEHSLRTSYGDVLVLLWWKNEQMLIDIDEYEER